MIYDQSFIVWSFISDSILDFYFEESSFRARTAFLFLEACLWRGNNYIYTLVLSCQLYIHPGVELPII